DEHRQVVERLSEAESTIANQEATIQQLQDNLQEVLGQGGGTTTPGTGGTETPGGTGTSTSTETAGTEAPPAQAGQTYIVQPGDTLSDIAEAVYGDPSQFGL